MTTQFESYSLLSAFLQLFLAPFLESKNNSCLEACLQGIIIFFISSAGILSDGGHLGVHPLAPLAPPPRWHSATVRQYPRTWSIGGFKRVDPGRGRTCNLLIRSQTPCPFGHRTSCKRTRLIGTIGSALGF